jgi:hypothetical protein
MDGWMDGWMDVAQRPRKAKHGALSTNRGKGRWQAAHLANAMFLFTHHDAVVVLRISA